MSTDSKASDVQYWCHSCADYVQIRSAVPASIDSNNNTVEEDSDAEDMLICSVCNDCFVEVVDGDVDEDHISHFTTELDNKQPETVAPATRTPLAANQMQWQSYTVDNSGNFIPNSNTTSQTSTSTASVINALRQRTVPTGPAYLQSLLGNMMQTMTVQNANHNNQNGHPTIQHLTQNLSSLLSGGLGLGGGNNISSNPGNYFGGNMQHILNQLHQQSNEGRSQPVSQDKLAALQDTKVQASEAESLPDCAVCKEAFAADTVYKELPCEHKYHPDCILPWLTTHNTCPVCRKVVG